MKNRLNIIKEIYFAKVTDVLSYKQRTDVFGEVTIDTTQWQKINRSPAPATLTVAKRKTTAGDEFTSDISIALREPVIVPEPVVLRIDLCDGESLIVGSPELPVFIESNIQLISKQLSISHKSWHYPLTYIV